MRTTHRRHLGTLVIVATLSVSMLGAAPADAASGRRINQLVSGPFTGTTSYQFSAEGCSFVHQVYDGTSGSTRRYRRTFHLEGCVGLTIPFPYTGTFGFRVRRHGTLTGTVRGSIGTSSEPCVPFDFVLTPTAGTGRFARVAGTIAVHGQWCRQGPVPALNDPISGQVKGALVRLAPAT